MCNEDVQCGATKWLCWEFVAQFLWLVFTHDALKVSLNELAYGSITYAHNLNCCSSLMYRTGHISVMIYLLVTEHVVFDRFINKSTTKIPSRTSPSPIYRRKITFNIYHVTDSFLLQSLTFFKIHFWLFPSSLPIQCTLWVLQYCNFAVHRNVNCR